MHGSIKVLVACFALCCCSPAGAAKGPLALDGTPVDPFSRAPHVSVFFFVRSDCPITNRYAPELTRIAEEFRSDHVSFWLVYPDASENVAAIRNHIAQYRLPGTPLRDLDHRLVARAHVTVAPEVAVFDVAGGLRYHGRIDDRYVDVGKARPAPQVHDLENAISDVLAGRPVPHPETHAIGCSLADLQ
jgi:hypothetical protein